jgi:epoxyqueuosine reductase
VDINELSTLIGKQGMNYLAVIHPGQHQAEEKEYGEWIQRGCFGKMGYLKDHAPLKLHPEKILPGCKAIILMGVNYFQKPKKLPKDHGRIARYAWGRDYHRVIGNKLKKIVSELKKLYPEDQFKYNADATPLLERAYAAEAGLGYIGNNTTLISKPYGSWILIGEILTTLKLPEYKLSLNHGSCGPCRKCLAACPTGALIRPGEMDARKCVSYLTIEYKEVVPEELSEKIGDRLFGCDACQECCPQNMRAKLTSESDFLKHRAGESFPLNEILAIKTDEEFRKRFAGSALMRAKREGLVRNACIVAENTRAKSCLPLLRKLTKDPSKTVATHAKRAIRKIQS